MTADVEAAIEDAYELAKRWLAKNRLSGQELHRDWQWMTALSLVHPPEELPAKYGEEPIPVFGGSEQTGIYVYDDDKGAKLIAGARMGDLDAHAVLCGFACDFIDRGCLLPPNLREYMVQKLREQFQAASQPRGRSPHSNRRRNFYIVNAVSRLTERGFQPTRNEATDGKESACSIISAALNRLGIDLTEHAVAKVWQQHRNILTDDAWRSMFLSS